MASDQIDIELAPIRDSVVDNQSDPASRTDAVPVSSQSTNSNTICNEELSHDEITKRTWKYLGYRGYCEFIAQINDNLIIRRFGALNVRVLLALQDKVALIEEKLQELDDEYSRPDAGDVHNGKMRGDKKNRRKLIRKAHTSLNQYYSFAKQFSEFAGHPEPYDRDVQNISKWLRYYEDCIHSDETKYLSENKHHDLFSLIPKTKSPLRRLFDKSDRFRLHPFFQRTPSSTLPVFEKEQYTYSSNNAKERVTAVIVITFGLVMLLAPAWILEFLENSVAKLGVISFFEILFVCVIQYALIVKQSETLAAAAAYAAVLMVFLQLGNNQ